MAASTNSLKPIIYNAQSASAFLASRINGMPNDLDFSHSLRTKDVKIATNYWKINFNERCTRGLTTQANFNYPEKEPKPSISNWELDPNANFSPVSQQYKKNQKSKAVWNNDAHKVFVDLCCEQMSKGSKVGTFFNRDGWNKICYDFVMKTGLNYDEKRLKTHWDNTKKDWKVWYKLRTSDTGLNWDSVKNTVYASDEWWDEYLQANPDAIKFRHKGLENSEELTSLFKEGYTTGKTARAPSEGYIPNDFGRPCRTQTTQPVENTNQADPEVEVQVEESNQTTKSKQTKNGFGDISGARHHKWAGDDIPLPKRSRKLSSASNIDKYLSRICETVEAMGASGKTTQECVNLLNEMSGVPQGSELYLFACRSFLKKEQRDLFIALGSSELRFLWLQDEKAQHDATFSRIYSV